MTNILAWTEAVKQQAEAKTFNHNDRAAIVAWAVNSAVPIFLEACGRQEEADEMAKAPVERPAAALTMIAALELGESGPLRDDVRQKIDTMFQNTWFSIELSTKVQAQAGPIQYLYRRARLLCWSLAVERAMRLDWESADPDAINERAAYWGWMNGTIGHTLAAASQYPALSSLPVRGRQVGETV